MVAWPVILCGYFEWDARLVGFSRLGAEWAEGARAGDELWLGDFAMGAPGRFWWCWWVFR